MRYRVSVAPRWRPKPELAALQWKPDVFVFASEVVSPLLHDVRLEV